MTLEMPLILYAHALSDAMVDAHLESCSDFYNTIKFKEDWVDSICSTSNEFSDVTNLNTTFRLVNIHFYKEKYNPHIMERLLSILNITEPKELWEPLVSIDSAFG